MKLCLLTLSLIFSISSFAEACKNRLERCNSGYVRVKDASEEGCFDCKKVPLPYITEDGQVWLGPETIEGLTTYQKCDVLESNIKYLGTQPVCVKETNCTVYYPTSFSDVREGTHSFSCAGGATRESCAKKSWQKCLIDPTFDGIDFKKCFKTQSGEIPAGCTPVSAKEAGSEMPSRSSKEDVTEPPVKTEFEIVLNPADVTAVDAAGVSVTEDPDVFAVKLQRSLEKLHCKASVQPFYKLRPAGRAFTISSKNCAIMKKANDSCPVGTAARSIDESFGAQKYKVCVKKEKPATADASESGQK